MIISIDRKSERFSRHVKTAIEHNLYMPDYVFEDLLKYNNDYIISLSLAQLEGKPVGIGLTWIYPPEYGERMSDEQIGVYVLPEHRRKGIAKQLIEGLGGIENREWRIGEDGSDKFWISLE